jgi:hypothetical protein
MRPLAAALGLCTLVAFTHGARAQPLTCQEMSDQFAIVTTKTFSVHQFRGFGLATLATQLAYQRIGCKTQPATARRAPLCQELSDTYGIVAGVTFGRASVTAQESWKAMGCSATPSCQALSDRFAMAGGEATGMAAAAQVKVWNDKRCTTRPSAARLAGLCEELNGISSEPDGRVIIDGRVKIRTRAELGCADPAARPLPDTSFGFRNAALRRPARLSSTGYGGDAARAVDGNTDGVWASGSIAHSGEQVSPWLEIDLGQEMPVRAVNVWARTDCCAERSANLQVELSRDPCDAPNRRITNRLAVADGPEARRVAEFPGLEEARFVCVHQPSAPNQKRWLNLAEVEVIVPYEESDNFVRFDASARQSSTGYGAEAKRAIDLNTSGVWGAGSISNTGSDPYGSPNDTAPWFEVDLREPRPIGKVVLFNRTDCCDERLAGARVELALDPCHDPFRRVAAVEMVPYYDYRIPKGLPETAHVAPRSELNFTDAPTAQYVCVRHVAPQFLALAEVEVYPGRVLENLARTGTARQSATSFEATAERAIDGNNDGVFEGGSVTFAESDEKTQSGTQLPPPWLEVDLGETKPVRQVVVYNRTDDCAVMKDGVTPSPEKGCNDRLGGAVVELADAPCDAPTFSALATHTVQRGGAEAQRFGMALPWRNAFDFPDGTSARYVCVRQPEILMARRVLSVAELQVSGPPAAPPRATDLALGTLGASAAALAGPAATVTPPTTSGAADRFSFQVALAGLKNLACSAERQGDGGYMMTCEGLGTTAMTGTFTSPTDFRLTSADTLGFGDLASRWFPAELARGLDLVAALAVSDVRLAASSKYGVSIVGKLNLQAPGGGALAAALENGQRFLAANVPGYNKNPLIEVVAAVVGGQAQLLMRAEVITTCAGPSKVAAVIAGMKFNTGALVLRVAASPTGPPSIGAALEGSGYLKPTDRDPWLRFSPALDLSTSVGSSAITVRGEVSGACEAGCAETCGCGLSDCQADWHPLGVSTIALRNGYVELGASTVVSQPVPVITMAFDRARVGSMTGKYAVSLNYPQKQVAFQLSANRLPLIGALGIVGVAGGNLPDGLTIKDPVVSFASTKTRVFNTDIPAGIRVSGSLEVPAIGARASLAVDLAAHGLIDPQDLSKGIDPALPTGHVSIGIDIGGLVDRVLSLPILGGWLRDVLERAFWLTKLELKLALDKSVTVGATVEFRLLGQTHSFGIDASVALRPDQLAVALANKLKSLLAGEPFKSLYNGVKKSFDVAAAAVSKALKEAGRVTINGVVTVGSVTFETAAVAADKARAAAEAFYNFLSNLCSFCP